MELQINSDLIQALVLKICKKESIYGYKIKQDVNISDSTLYQILCKLEKTAALYIKMRNIWDVTENIIV